MPDSSINCAVSEIGTPIHLSRSDPDVEGNSSGKSDQRIKDPFIPQDQLFLYNTVSGLITFLKVYSQLNIHVVRPCDRCCCVYVHYSYGSLMLHALKAKS